LIFPLTFIRKSNKRREKAPCRSGNPLDRPARETQSTGGKEKLDMGKAKETCISKLQPAEIPAGTTLGIESGAHRGLQIRLLEPLKAPIKSGPIEAPFELLALGAALAPTAPGFPTPSRYTSGKEFLKALEHSMLQSRTGRGGMTTPRHLLNGNMLEILKSPAKGPPKGAPKKAAPKKAAPKKAPKA
jgi:hypothetical protein